MWPFKRFDSSSKYNKYSENAPSPRCGNKAEHYLWVDIGFPCPCCAAYDEKTKEDRMAKKIAEKLHEMMKEKK